MKPTAIPINTARGPVVDEAALSTPSDKRIYGAGLDVYEHELCIHPELLTLDSAVPDPHIGSAAATCATACS